MVRQCGDCASSCFSPAACDRGSARCTYDETDGGAPGDNALGDNMQLICLVDSAIGLAASLRLAHRMRLVGGIAAGWEIPHRHRV